MWLGLLGRDRNFLFVIQKICLGSGEETQSAASVKTPDFNGLLPTNSAFCGHDAKSQLQTSVSKFDTRLSVAEEHSGILHQFPLSCTALFCDSILTGPCYSAENIRHSDFRFSVYSYDFFIQFSSSFSLLNHCSVLKSMEHLWVNLIYTGAIQWHRQLISQATSVNNLTCLNKLCICFIKHYIPWQRGLLVAVRHRPL